MIKIGPVNLEKFSGRKFELQRLEKIKIDYLKGYRRNLALVGPVNIGKTSLILKFIHEGLKGDIFPLYLNLEEGFLKESFLGFLLFSLQRESGAEYKFPLSSVVDISKKIEKEFSFLTPQIRNIESNLSNSNFKAILESIFKLPKLIKNNFGKNCLFILDEFFGLEKVKSDYWIQLLKEHIMLDKHVLFILISSDIERSKIALNSELSLLFGNFELIELSNFSYEESLEFMQERIKNIKYDKKVLDVLISLTDGRPLYLDLLSSWIYENLSVLDWEGLMFSLKENLLEDKGFLYRYFQEKLNLTPAMRKPQEFLSFVTEIARGRTRRKELQRRMKLGYSFCNQSLNGFLEKSGSFYRVKDPLFRIWLLYAYRPDLMGLKFDLENRLSSLSQEVKKISFDLSCLHIDTFKSEQLQNFIKDILSRFDNEFIEIDGRRKFLPKFSHINEVAVKNNYVILKGIKKGKGSWLIVLFLSSVREEIVYELLVDLKGKLAEYNQKVAISISNTDESSKSIMKAKGFWFWNREFLNNLLEFYGISPESYF